MSTKLIPTVKISPEQILGIVQNGGSLIDGRVLTCPFCENRGDILDYIPLEHSEKYAAQLVPPLKCRRCRHVFALRP